MRKRKRPPHPLPRPKLGVREAHLMVLGLSRLGEMPGTAADEAVEHVDHEPRDRGKQLPARPPVGGCPCAAAAALPGTGHPVHLLHASSRTRERVDDGRIAAARSSGRARASRQTMVQPGRRPGGFRGLGGSVQKGYALCAGHSTPDL